MKDRVFKLSEQDLTDAALAFEQAAWKTYMQQTTAEGAEVARNNWLVLHNVWRARLGIGPVE